MLVFCITSTSYESDYITIDPGETVDRSSSNEKTGGFAKPAKGRSFCSKPEYFFSLSGDSGIRDGRWPSILFLVPGVPFFLTGFDGSYGAGRGEKRGPVN